MYGIAAAIGVACVAGLMIGGQYLASLVPTTAEKKRHANRETALMIPIVSPIAEDARHSDYRS